MRLVGQTPASTALSQGPENLEITGGVEVNSSISLAGSSTR
jgi:hypothetical protein